MKSITTKNFSLKHTLECGQIFRYDLVNGYYFVVSGDKIIKLRQKGNKLLYDSNSEQVNDEFIKDFFRLNEDYEEIIKEISKDKYVKEAIKRVQGLRLIRQEPFECLISYMCSAVSNIPRIKKNVNDLAKCAGKKVVFENYESYAFPEPKTLKEEAVKKCKLGFRAERVYEALNNVDYGFFKKLRTMSYEEAKRELIKLKGVGEKVADCVLLFSLGFDEAFPVDTWIRKAMTKNYFKNKATTDKEIRKLAAKKFKKHAGYAQQFLFYDARNKQRNKQI